MNGLDATSLFLPLPDSLVITSLAATTTQLVVQVTFLSSAASCPLCQQLSERVQGHYERSPICPVQVGASSWGCRVRKFVCGTSICPQQIFAERLPDLVQSYARITNRLRKALIDLGLATSAQVCTRLAPKLGVQVSSSTLLRAPRTLLPHSFWRGLFSPYPSGPASFGPQTRNRSSSIRQRWSLENPGQIAPARRQCRLPRCFW